LKRDGSQQLRFKSSEKETTIIKTAAWPEEKRNIARRILVRVGEGRRPKKKEEQPRSSRSLSKKVGGGGKMNSPKNEDMKEEEGG